MAIQAARGSIHQQPTRCIVRCIPFSDLLDWYLDKFVTPSAVVENEYLLTHPGERTYVLAYQVSLDQPEIRIILLTCNHGVEVLPTPTSNSRYHIQ